MTALSDSALDRLLALASAWIVPDQGSLPAWPDDPEVGDEIEHLARRHGLLPWLHAMGGRDPGWRPGSERYARWEAVRFECYAHQSALYDLLEQVVAGCRDTGCEVAALKGPATAARLWGDVGLRPTSDLDLLCRAEDLLTVARVVRACGLTPGSHDATYHMSFRGDRPGFVLELHFGLYDFLDSPQARRLLFDSIVEIDLDGREVPVLSPEATLVFGLAHWMHHDGDLRLPQLMELAAAIWRPTVDPDAVAEAIRTARLADGVAVMVRALGRLFALPGAPAVLAAPQRLAHLDSGFERRVRAALHAREEIDRRPPLAETRIRGGWKRVSHALRLLWPPSRELRALHDCGWWGAQVRRPAHVVSACRRAVGKLRAQGLAVNALPSAGDRPAGPETSLKREVYRRSSRRSR